MKIARYDSAVKLGLQWLSWPPTQRIGKDIRTSSLFFTRRAADASSEACFTLMTRDRYDDPAAMDLSMIAVALTPSWLVWILKVMPVWLYFSPFLFCSVFFFWTRHFIYFTSVSCVWFLLPYVSLRSNWAWKLSKLDRTVHFIFFLRIFVSAHVIIT